MWRAFDLMVERALTREVHGGLLQDKQFVQGFIADSYIDIQAARLMTIHAAETDRPGARGRPDGHLGDQGRRAGRVPRVVDRAIQVWGAAGVSNDLPLAAMYQGARTLRIADGPDEVHKVLIAKNVLGQYRDGRQLGLRDLRCTRARSSAATVTGPQGLAARSVEMTHC